MKTIAFTNQKGGVGKTTSAVTVAAAAAERGADVLVVDLDAQGSSTELFLGRAPEGLGLSDVLAGGGRWADAVVTGREPGAIGEGSGRIDVLPATEGLTLFEESLAESGDLWAVGKLVASVRKSDRYGLCVVDCPPAIGRLSLNAVAGADLIVAPVTLSSLSMRGIVRLRQMVDAVEGALGEVPRVLYLPCAVDARYSETAEFLDVLHQAFGYYPEGDVLPAVRTSSAASRSYARALTAVEYRPDGRLADDYRAVLDTLSEHGSLALPSPAAA
ncbi:ParA family protein [Rubrivirga sp. S365]|uniref:ParA family protein n=1 Tax=Rubrivirga sp. S365 TaxID=3076080 RepID=UPI0028C620B2|nr:ParA family protein [Rubrivirga sp. S365]MDT7858063.1 ParA family protein [Rubrivirga sp. S365]